MPGTNLTRDEARTRSDLVRVESYDVHLDFSAGGDTFDSVTTIRFAATAPGASTFVDLIAPRVREITLNGAALDPEAVYADGRIALDRLAEHNEVRVAADCAYMNTGEGLHRTVDPVDGRTYLYTHFEVPNARRLYATMEQPDLKASFAFTVTAPSGWVVLSNSATPEPVPAAAPGVSTWQFEPTPPISTYITAVIAGEYHIVHDQYTAPDGQLIPLAVACRQSLARYLDADNIFEFTKQGFDYYLGRFGHAYPFAKYDQIFVPEYNIGAMENVGCVTVVEGHLFRSRVTDAQRLGRAGTLLHELAHMWFGDLVTMRWWDDLWLKESFATYVAVRCLAEATRFTSAWTTFANDDKAWGLAQDQLPSTHPIVANIRDLDDVSLNFDGITYAKGAAVLKQLVAWVGDDEFFAGMRHYFNRHAWGNTSLTDLLDALEKTSGRDLGAWSREWLETAGPNTLRPDFTVDDEGRFTSFAVLQEAPAAYPTLRSHRIAIGGYDQHDGRLVRTHRVELDIAGPRTEVADLVGRARPAVILLNDDDLTFATIRLDADSLATLSTAPGIGAFVDSLPRALCWAAAWDMTRSAELSARDYLRLVLGGIATETDIGVVEVLLAQMRAVLDSYVAPGHRAEAAATASAAARTHMYAAAPASDLQLAWVRFFVRSSRRDEDLDLIAGLRDGVTALDGLEIDTELRWALVGALARGGRLDAADVEAERARDNTTTGNQYAAGVLAAFPTAEAKAHAWASVIDRDDLPNRTQEKVIGARPDRVGGGFAQTGQVELLRPYAERYFEVVRDIWASRTTEISRTIAYGLFPRYLVDQWTLDRTDAFLAQEMPAALTRVIREGQADVARFLAAQRRDARTSR
jgi:aminopeptidase N